MTRDASEAPLPLTVTLITKDEEAEIAEALASVGFAAEVVVVDSGSEDRTVALAEAAGARVKVTEDWPGYGRQKNRAAELATQPWILNLDADERVTPELAAELRQRFASGIADEVVGFRVPRRNWFFGAFVARCGYWPDHQLRVYRKDRARFNERGVHESVQGAGRVEDLKAPLLHWSYRRAQDFVTRQDRYALLAALELHRAGRRVSLAGLFLRPLAAFLKTAILRGGVLAGWRGLFLSWGHARYVAAKYGHLFARQQDEAATSS